MIGAQAGILYKLFDRLQLETTTGLQCSASAVNNKNTHSAICHLSFFEKSLGRYVCVQQSCDNNCIIFAMERCTGLNWGQGQNEEAEIAKIFAEDLSKVHQLLFCQMSEMKNNASDGQTETLRQSQ